MTEQSPWRFLRSGEIARGLNQIEELYPTKPTASNIMRRGAALLWARDYNTAWQHFTKAAVEYRHSISIFYGMAGAAKWCLNEPEHAASQWNLGLKAEWTDPAAIRIQLLLWFASVVNPDTFSRVKAEELLRKAIDNPRSKIWPGPIAKRLLGQISETELRTQFTGRNQIETALRRWSAEFYEGVRELSLGNLAGFKEAMRRAADTSGSDWSDEKPFLGLLWHEEFFIARYEEEQK